MADVDESARRAVEPHLESAEQLRAAVPGYSYLGLRRLVIGVTDRRVIVVRCGYRNLAGKKLEWADPLNAVKLRGDIHTQRTVAGLKTGNATMFLRRADGQRYLFNPRNGFFSSKVNSNAAKLLELIPVIDKATF